MLAKSKLNSIETLISQALIDLEISHEELKIIVNETEKYERMKENIIMMESSDELSGKNKSITVNRESAQNYKNIYIFLNMYKLFKTSAETFAKNKVWIIIGGENKLRLKIKTQKKNQGLKTFMI